MNTFNIDCKIKEAVRSTSLLIMSLEGQYLARFDAPKTGWTYSLLCDVQRSFLPEWAFCGFDAYLGDHCIGHSIAMPIPLLPS